MFCPFCGQELDISAKFCTNCGKAIPDADRTLAARASAAHAAPAPAPLPAQDLPAGSAPAPQRSIPKALIPAVVIAAAACAALFCWFRFAKAGDAPVTPDQAPAVTDDAELPGHTAAPDGDGEGGAGLAASGTPAPTPSATPVPPSTPAPTPIPAPVQTPATVPGAQFANTAVVFHNAHPNGKVFVDGVEAEFLYDGGDVILPRAFMKDVCQVRIVAEKDGAFETAAVWYNKAYGDELSFDADYGGYVPCDASGKSEPSQKVIDVLLWAYHDSFLRCINEQTTSLLRYSTAANTKREESHIFSETNAKNTYSLDNFHAGCDPESITYRDGTVTLNATFVSYATSRKDGKTTPVTSNKTMELVWEDGVWKVNRLAFVSDEDFAAHRYAELP